MESYFQHWFSVSIRCSITGKCLTGPFIIEQHMTVAYCPNFLQDSLAVLLKDFPLHARLKMWFRYEVAPPHVGWQVTEYFTYHFPNWWIHHFDSYPSTTSCGPTSRTPFTSNNYRQEKNCSGSCSLLPVQGEVMNLLYRYCVIVIFTFIPTNCTINSTTILLLYSVHSLMFWLTSAIFRDISFVLISPQRWLNTNTQEDVL
jgi:hypothetical protein